MIGRVWTVFARTALSLMLFLMGLLLQSFGVSPEEIEQVLKEFDTNNDGEIDYNGMHIGLLFADSLVFCHLPGEFTAQHAGMTSCK